MHDGMSSCIIEPSFETLSHSAPKAVAEQSFLWTQDSVFDLICNRSFDEFLLGLRKESDVTENVAAAHCRATYDLWRVIGVLTSLCGEKLMVYYSYCKDLPI